MSKGMWTKHYTEDGKIFYFNAAQNRSVWTTPFDAIIHEAPNLQKPTEKTEAILNEEENPAISLISQENNSESIHPFPTTTLSQTPVGQYSLPPQTIDVQPTPILTSLNHQDDLNSKRNNELLLEMQAKIDQALVQKQKEITAKKQAQKKVDSE